MSEFDDFDYGVYKKELNLQKQLQAEELSEEQIEEKLITQKQEIPHENRLTPV